MTTPPKTATRASLPPDAMPVAAHLDELRRRIIACLLWVAGGTAAGFLAAKKLLILLQIPSHGIVPHFFLFRPTDIVSIYVKISLAAGILIALPALIFHAWKFLKPAVPAGTRIPWLSWTLWALLLFACGASFSFYLLIPAGLRFLYLLSSEVAQPMFTLNGYISFALALLLLGGTVFEMPLAAAALARLGVITPKLMRRKRREAIFVLCIAAAVLTPTTDIFNMTLFVVPMLALYEVSILAASLATRSSNTLPVEDPYAEKN